MPRRAVLALLVVTAAVAAGACSGGSSAKTSPSTPAAPPAAHIDPNANGTFTGPINQARRTAGQQDEQQRQLDSQTGNG